MRKILITNDDGICASGLIRLAECAKSLGEVWVVAPDNERSAMSHSLTLRHSFDAWKVDFPVEGVHAFACTGTPADCVRIGVLNIMPEKPDVIFSGINYGFNVATDIQYSATANAAFEGAFQRIPSIAVSENFDEDHSASDRYLKEIMEKLIDQAPGEDMIWNVNFPACSAEEVNGILWDRTVSRDVVFSDTYDETPGEDGRVSYMVHGIRSYQAMEGTDLHAILNNYISVGKVRNIG